MRMSARGLQLRLQSWSMNPAIQRNLSLANRLIADLPPVERGLLLAQANLVELHLHAVLVRPGEACGWVWFPVEGWVAQMLPLAAGNRSHTAAAGEVGMAMTGSEGLLNTSLLLGVTQGALLGRVMAAGRAFQVAAAPLRQLMQERSALRERLYRYVDVQQRQLAQQALCMNCHAVEQRLVRCLLMARDRMQSHELFLTHELLAPLLGVRRESVTQAASALQRRGLVSYSRGYLMLLDEPALQRLACPCFETDLASYEDGLGEASLAPSSLGRASAPSPYASKPHAGTPGSPWSGRHSLSIS